VRVSLGRDPVTGRYRYVHRQVNGGKRVAQRVAAELVAEVDHGGHQTGGSHTVTELLERWMAHIEAQGRAPSTLARYRSAIAHDIGPQLGTKRIDRLTGADLDAFYARLAKRGLGPLSIRKSHAILSASLNQALKWGWLDRNPVVRATPPGVRSREIVPPTTDEVRRLLEACEAFNADLASLVYVAVTTGCRRGELCGLRWSDVDLDAATLVVVRSISDASGQLEVKDTKTHSARRLALDPSTVEVLRRHHTRVLERARAAGVTVGPSSYVWSQDLAAAAPYRPNRVTSAFRTLTANLGMQHITFHSLRHFAATALAGQGIGVRTIAGRLGHANPSLTLRTYAHFLDAADRDAAAAIGAVVTKLLAPGDSRPGTPTST
ncbi:MAG: tyrosine-type recombinase/integrase, partial [Acidimicrobiales bacterium]